MADEHNVQFVINDHFFDFIDDWNHKMYLLVGGYGSSKSYHVAVKLIKKLLEERRKALVVREVFDTIAIPVMTCLWKWPSLWGYRITLTLRHHRCRCVSGMAAALFSRAWTNRQS